MIIYLLIFGNEIEIFFLFSIFKRWSNVICNNGGNSNDYNIGYIKCGNLIKFNGYNFFLTSFLKFKIIIIRPF